MTGGLAGAGAPWIAEQIKLHTGHMDKDGTWVSDNETARLVSHAILGAVVAELQGNSGLAGGAGAVGGELASKIILDNLYAGKDIKDLTEAEKQNISALTQLVMGLSTAVSGGDAGDISTSIAASKNAVENNGLSWGDGGNGFPVPVGNGTIEYIEIAREVNKELDKKCGSDCTEEEISQALKDAKLISNDRLSEEDKENLKSLGYYIPGAGFIYGVSDSIKENDITAALEATLAQLKAGWVLSLVGKQRQPLTIDKIIETSTEGKKTTGRSTLYERAGGFSQANFEFDQMKPTNIKIIDGGRVGTLPDGRKIIVRNKSSDGRPTLEIQSGKNKIKFRYSE